jgi:hypothetical protein
LGEAPLVFGGGAGVIDPSSLVRAAEPFGAAVGGTAVPCSHAALPGDRLIGASGVLLGARCYVAFGVGGSPHHLAAVEGVQLVVSVNPDPWAPMNDRADVAVLSDANAVLERLVQLATQEPSGRRSPLDALFAHRQSPDPPRFAGPAAERLERLLLPGRGGGHRLALDDAGEAAAAVAQIVLTAT